MKKILMAMFLAAALSGCDKGPLADLELENSELAAAGKCNCAVGFEGYRCEWREIDKFLGRYPEGRRMQGGKVETVSVHELAESTLGNAFFQILDGLHVNPIQAEVDGWNFNIRKQNNFVRNLETGEWEEVEVEGYGWIDQAKGILVYELWNMDSKVELEIE